MENNENNLKVADKIKEIIYHHSTCTWFQRFEYTDCEIQIMDALTQLVEEEREKAFKAGKRWQVDFENGLPEVKGKKLEEYLKQSSEEEKENTFQKE